MCRCRIVADVSPLMLTEVHSELMSVCVTIMFAHASVTRNENADAALCSHSSSCLQQRLTGVGSLPEKPQSETS